MNIQHINPQDLIRSLKESHQAMLNFVEGLTPQQRFQAGACGYWSVKDVLAHLLLWESETIKLLFQARQGIKPSTIHFKKISADEQNALWYTQFKDRPFERVWGDYQIIRDQTIRRINEYSSDELNNPTLFPWLKGKNTLAMILTSDILDHEQEHLRGLIEWQKTFS
ncbi:MAG: hypothetical protein KatS3mg046_407 [Bellilinea sp.]|nr:MAG: hypothetical protein KatS3mg046_407 [Bellilinea sp.]